MTGTKAAKGPRHALRHAEEPGDLDVDVGDELVAGRLRLGQRPGEAEQVGELAGQDRRDEVGDDGRRQVERGEHVVEVSFDRGDDRVDEGGLPRRAQHPSVRRRARHQS
ncbi:hypothetical protein B277_15519 [Janibacter hoylei PVAS-1]|uniref:Uncharacterized protein n=1 Tax=Janibacter hoylei PVAS-1 TaxID=1210046 RepID=K1EKV0_9MICO|nr:hypothetical protein [Janibacter hoylei]EKA59953.1 hypothetical protein B277_15519 [Janibacter hoylei PVAS-1]